MSDDEKSLQKALNKMADLLARRNHSEAELREKLNSSFESHVVDQALMTAQTKKWLLDPEELSQIAAASWRRAHKSAHYISEQLKKRGLPPLAADEQQELKKMKELLTKKFSWHINDEYEILEWDDQQRIKALRFLANRGFSEDLIHKIIPGDF